MHICNGYGCGLQINAEPAINLHIKKEGRNNKFIIAEFRGKTPRSPDGVYLSFGYIDVNSLIAAVDSAAHHEIASRHFRS